MRNLIFTGFMAAGKSTLARAAALEFGLVFLDSDALIEARFGARVSQIFAERGEGFFREEEARLAEFFARCCGASIATGGGFLLGHHPPEKQASQRRGAWGGRSPSLPDLSSSFFSKNEKTSPPQEADAIFKKMGLCIYLRASFDYLRSRLSPQELASRPLFADEAGARRLYNERLAAYEARAGLIIDVEGRGEGELLAELRKFLKGRG